MREFTVSEPKEVIKINYEDTSFTIPLGTMLPFDEAMKISTAKGDKRIELMFDFIKKNIPEDIYGKLTVGAIQQIFTAWSEATKEASGTSMGES